MHPPVPPEESVWHLFHIKKKKKKEIGVVRDRELLLV